MEIIKKIIKSFIIGTLAGLIVALITNYFVPDLIDRLEHQSYYMRYYWKYMELGEKKEAAQGEEESGIFIVDIDDRTMHKLGNYWNWNRSYHAELVNTLTKHYPAAIVFDINFYDPEDQHHKDRIEALIARSKELNPDAALSDKVRASIVSTIDYDEQFIDATARSCVVYQGVRLSDERDYPDHALSQVEERKSMEWHKKLNPESAIELSPAQRARLFHVKDYIDGIFPELARAARGIGHLNIPPNSDGVIREVPLLYAFGKNTIAYLPISIRTVASLFATPNEEIRFEPGKYIDIGKPFKIFRDKDGTFSFSYPNFSASQVKAIMANGGSILALAPGQSITISSYLAIGVEQGGGRFISMYCGTFPQPIVDAFAASDMTALLSMEVGSQHQLAADIVLRRDSDVDWVLTAPFGDEEYYLAKDDVMTLGLLDYGEFEALAEGEQKLIFHTFSAKNKNGKLLSSIPVLRENTLKELCRTTWSDIEKIEPGKRRDFGDAVRIPLNPDNQHIVTYFGPKGKPFKYYSYYDIMKDRLQGALEGKVFIVGSTVPNMFDIVSVPLSNVYPGVEVHASLMHAFISNTFVTALGTWQEFIILLLVGVIIGVISYMLKPLPGAMLTLAAVFGYFLLAMTVFGADNLWIPIARPILTLILTFTAVMAYRYITEEKDRLFLQSTFKQYLSPELIDIMYKNKQMPKLGGEEGIRTAYFTDIQSFSTFSEKLGSPTRLVELLNEYLTAMTDTLLAHFGTLDKYEGDAIIAFFGAPMPMDDHAQQACATALDMQRKLGELRTKWTAEGDKWPAIVHNMRMRIGINTGAITTGNMGSTTRMNYTMMGDAVNLAARLESAAKQYGVYTMISQATYDIVKDQFEARQVDKIQVVGKSEPVIVYELLCEKGALDETMRKILPVYTEGLKYFYDRQWDKAIELFTTTHAMEPFREIAPKGMTPSKKFIEYSKMYKENPPPPDWDGVMALTSK